jgi:hypothetical protein
MPQRWDDEAIERELGWLIAQVGQYPTAAQAQVRGLGSLHAAVVRSGRAAEWARRFGVDPPATRKAPRTDDWERGEPTRRELRELE